MKNCVTGILLAGGKSSRMGTDKGMVMLNGKKLAAHILDAMKPVVDHLIIVANNRYYDAFGYSVFSDVVKDCGPMGGIYTGLINSNTRKNLVLSCDIPYVTSRMLTFILAHAEDAEIIFPSVEGNPEPLCAVYDQTCAEKIRMLIDKRELKMQDALRQFKTKELPLTKEEAGNNFININTFQQLNAQNT